MVFSDFADAKDGDGDDFCCGPRPALLLVLLPPLPPTMKSLFLLLRDPALLILSLGVTVPAILRAIDTVVVEYELAGSGTSRAVSTVEAVPLGGSGISRAVTAEGEDDVLLRGGGGDGLTVEVLTTTLLAAGVDGLLDPGGGSRNLGTEDGGMNVEINVPIALRACSPTDG